jgi:DNA-binding transcriptional MerR regulator
MAEQDFQKQYKMNLRDNPLPEIPDKRYFSIGEVGDLCGLKPYVLRYWEQEFPQLKPLKRHGNRRYYRRNDVLLIRQIRQLLYEKGFTIEGAKAQLSNNKKETINLNRIVYCLQETVIKLENILVKLKHTKGGMS